MTIIITNCSSSMLSSIAAIKIPNKGSLSDFNIVCSSFDVCNNKVRYYAKADEGNISAYCIKQALLVTTVMWIHYHCHNRQLDNGSPRLIASSARASNARPSLSFQWVLYTRYKKKVSEKCSSDFRHHSAVCVGCGRRLRERPPFKKAKTTENNHKASTKHQAKQTVPCLLPTSRSFISREGQAASWRSLHQLPGIAATNRKQWSVFFGYSWHF